MEQHRNGVRWICVCEMWSHGWSISTVLVHLIVQWHVSKITCVVGSCAICLRDRTQHAHSHSRHDEQHTQHSSYMSRDRESKTCVATERERERESDVSSTEATYSFLQTLLQAVYPLVTWTETWGSSPLEQPERDLQIKQHVQIKH